MFFCEGRFFFAVEESFFGSVFMNFFFEGLSFFGGGLCLWVVFLEGRSVFFVVFLWSRGGIVFLWLICVFASTM